MWREKIQAWVQRRKYYLMGFAVLALSYYFILPDPLFKDPSSTILLDRNGQLLGARIAQDEQWRFPPLDSVPHKFKAGIITFEDKRFLYHPGVDPLAFGRAFFSNISAGKIVSGGSTLSMQVIRLMRKGKSRTILEKAIEMLMALRMEMGYSKSEILALYATNAPFGGNVVGLETAAWKYYGRSAYQLSWAETATLAVLPNAPSLIHPGKNRDLLLEKRNRLLEKLRLAGYLDSLSAYLAMEEPLPDKPLPLPSSSPHLLERFHRHPKLVQNRSTLQLSLQKRAEQILQHYHQRFVQTGVHNLATLIIEVKTGDVLVYIGNMGNEGDNQEELGQDVDIIVSPRSTGSVLKPFLYASMLQEGQLLPNTLVPDIPSYYSGFTPTNYDFSYSGAVPAQRALARSLNIPSVRMLSDHGIAKFQDLLIRLGFSHLHRAPEQYGLSLVLGGAEASLWDLCGVYASLARNLGNYSYYGGKYEANAFRAPNLNLTKRVTRPDPSQANLQEQTILSASAIWHMFEAMVAVSRPENDRNWQYFESSRKIAWKTGTSFGARDAWAIGCTPDYVVGVWAGNASGEGRPSLTGIGATAPIMFDLFNMLPANTAWFQAPYHDMRQLSVCKQSGFRSGNLCKDTYLQWTPLLGEESPVCPYHTSIWVDAEAAHRLHSDCASPLEMHSMPWFILPPAMEYYYKNRHPDYRMPPPFRKDCATNSLREAMELIYPRHAAKIYIPINLDGTMGSTVFEIAHREEQIRVFWHLDDNFAGETVGIHQMALAPGPGKHVLTWVDENGEILVRDFEILVRDQ